MAHPALPPAAGVVSRRWILAAVAGTVLLAAPYALPEFWLRVLIGICLWAGLAQSWNIIGGYTGYLNFGHGAFFGIGAYATALGMTRLGLPLAVTLVLGGLLTMAVALVIGVPTLRLRGPYFAIATWAFAEMVKQLALVLPFTGGAYGAQIVTPLNDALVYYVMFGMLLVTMGTTWWLMERSAFGYRLRAIREHEVAAETLGIDTTTAKLHAFVLSAFFPGVFGGIYAYWISFVHPHSVLDALITDQMVVMVLLGGLGTFYGPLVGATVLWLLNRVIWTYWGDSVTYMTLLGLAVCLVVLYLPNGVVGLWEGRRGGGAWRDNLRHILGRLGVNR